MSDAAASAEHQTTTKDDRPRDSGAKKDYRGFVAGVFSGVSKLAVGHPFDTIKVRLQTASESQFSGPIDCVVQTVRKEGLSGFYKGATPPLIGWMFMDSLMLGSLTFYRRVLHENVFTYENMVAYSPSALRPTYTVEESKRRLPLLGHCTAGLLAGWTVSFVAAPFEHVKARLQIQYAAEKSQRLYSGPIQCTRRILAAHGVPGLWHGLSATLLFRSFFIFWWGSYDVFSQYFAHNTNLSTPAINFWAGGLSAQVFWLTAYPSDVVKQRIMTDSLGGSLGDGERKYPRWKDAARAVYRDSGWKGYWRGFVPSFLRAFPANATALLAFETVMRYLP